MSSHSVHEAVTRAHREALGRRHMSERAGFGSDLVFLISQPRSGSTLLQHILGAHSQIATLPEPWLMLHLVYGCRTEGISAEYNSRFAALAASDFLSRIPGGETLYWDLIREAASALYARARHSSGKRFFLDKTPRYYLIIPELARLFPDARFVFLIRNPLAVLASILAVNLRGDWLRLFTVPDRRHDILTAPRRIVAGVQTLGSRASVVRYEALVADPEGTVGGICEAIGLPYEPSMVRYGDRVRFHDTTFVDPKSVYAHQAPVRDYLDQWVETLDTPQKVYVARKYAEELGEPLIRDLGYDYAGLLATLDSRRSFSLGLCFPWKLLITPNERQGWWMQFRRKILSALRPHRLKGRLYRWVRRPRKSS